MLSSIKIFMSSLIILLLITIISIFEESSPVCGYTRADFPSDFIFGAGSASHQVEGAAFEDGRTPSIMDTYNPGNVDLGIKYRACDEYHKYKEDVKLMVDTGLEAYKFSISWSRIIPNGRGPINPKAVEYYNNLIDELTNNGIQPHALLLHMDMPQALEDDYGGWINHQIVKDFTTYADVCFREFGDRVLYWTTFNEPNVLLIEGYDIGIFPPRRCSPPFGSCTRGNSTTEPYIAAHNMLLAHASVVKLYRAKYQGKQHGYVGINVFAGWLRPKTDTKEDLLAVQIASKFLIGWFLDPLAYGDYPDIMKKRAGNRIPRFTEQESQLVKNSVDFIGVNCYSSLVVADNPSSLLIHPRDWSADSGIKVTYEKDHGNVLERMLEYFKEAYANPPICIHENGFRMYHNASVNDTPRIEYLNASIGSVLNAVRNGSNVRGYFVWSFLDMIEVAEGDKWAFGLYYVDFNNSDLKRYPKLSAHWYSTFLKERSSLPPGITLQANDSTNAFQALRDH